MGGRGSNSGVGGATRVLTAKDRKTGERYRAKPGEIIVKKNGRELLVKNAHYGEYGGKDKLALADYYARYNGQWTELKNANKSALQDYARTALGEKG